MDLAVQKIIRSCGLDALSELSISVKRHPKYSNLVHLSYHQYESPMDEVAVRECRGLILDEESDWNIVSFPYKKFFNYGEKHADEIDWSTASVWEKLDGSLITMYWYDNDWHVSTTGTPDADTPIGNMGVTYREKFWELFDKTLFEADIRDINKLFSLGCCYMFELVGPGNRIIVNYDEWDLYLHGARGIGSGRELDPNALRAAEHFKIPKRYDLHSLSDVILEANSNDPTSLEGFVVCDSNRNRIKVKSERYVELHYLRSQLNPKKILDVVRKGESSEFLAYFPEWKCEFDRIEVAYNVLCDQIDRDFSRFSIIEDRKEFAQRVESIPTKHVLFALKSGKAKNARDWAANVMFPTLEKLFFSFCGFY